MNHNEKMRREALKYLIKIMISKQATIKQIAKELMITQKEVKELLDDKD